MSSQGIINLQNLFSQVEPESFYQNEVTGTANMILKAKSSMWHFHIERPRVYEEQPIFKAILEANKALNEKFDHIKVYQEYLEVSKETFK